jgi:hypothetical protein
MTRTHRLVARITAAAVVAALGVPQTAAAEQKVIDVADVETLYAAVNDPDNTGALVVIAPGIYMLTALDPTGVARPNGGRLELRENMSLLGTVGDRSAVVIDAVRLPATSYVAQAGPGLPTFLTGPIRVGRGSNAIEWLTFRNAARQGGIETDLLGTDPADVRIAHIVSTGNVRGIEVRNFGPWTAGRSIDAQLVDNDVYGNTAGLGEGIRIVNILGADGGRIRVRLSGNRIYGNDVGVLVVNNGSNLAEISVSSTGDRVFENGGGVIVIGGLGSNATANGNTITFEASGSHFNDNNGFADFDRGGLIVIGGENISIPNRASSNTVRVGLNGCRLERNQLMDLGVFGARSVQGATGMLPGTNNHVEITLRGAAGRLPEGTVIANSLPDDPAWMNTAVINR